jgi:hypothetical protein
MPSDVRQAPLNPFLNCEMEFECSKNWFELTDTDKAGIKRCSTCGRNVHLCVTQNDLDALSSKGECIAFFSEPDLQTRFKLSREKAEANLRNSEFKLGNVTLGLPKSNGRMTVNAFLDGFNGEEKS